MTGQSTLPSTREQARHGLLLLGVPVSPRLLVDVHRALLDGDLSVPALAALIRDEERSLPAADGLDSVSGSPGGGGGTGRSWYAICPGLNTDLTAARGMVTLSSWPIADRMCTPKTARAQALAAVIRVAEFAPVRPGACATWLLRQLAEVVPGGPEAIDVLKPLALAEVARAALDDPALSAAVAAEAPAREAAAARAAGLDLRHRLFGLRAGPHQRGGA